MKAIAIAALACSGCATSWLISEAAGKPQVWDESVHEVKVPEPGIAEHLTVTMPLTIQHEPQQPAAAGQLPVPPKALPFAFTCSTDQDAQDLVYHSAYRYGSRWTKGALLMFVFEGAAAAAFYFDDNPMHPEEQLYAAFLGADAIGSGILALFPRKEIYRREQRPVATHVRSDCPEGLELSIAGTGFPIDAAGRLGELGDAAVAQWMHAPSTPIELHVAGQARDLPLDDSARCTWLRDHDRSPCSSLGSPLDVVVKIPVAAGTLARE